MADESSHSRADFETQKKNDKKKDLGKDNKEIEKNPEKRKSKKCWEKVEGIDPEDYQYEPKQFVRSHCKDNNPTDVSTAIWDVCFEPSVDGSTNYRVATCGGRFLCIFDVRVGDLVMKYKHKNNEESLYCLSWTTIQGYNILASGSATGELRLYHPERKVSFHSWKADLQNPSSTSVNAIRWHHQRSNWVFVATSDSNHNSDFSCVTLWDVSGVDPPNYQNPSHIKVFKFNVSKGDLYTMDWCDDSHWLLLGTQDGLVGWHLDKLIQSRQNGKSYKPPMVEFILPRTDGSFVDSVCGMGGNLVAVKCVDEGKIMVLRLGGRDKEDEEIEKKKMVRRMKADVIAIYPWHKTDNFYMNIGCNKRSGLFVCGDDEGLIWFYKLKESDREKIDVRQDTKKYERRSPIGRIPWPQLEDENLDKRRPSPLAQDTIIDKVSISLDDQYVVAVTNTNTVCIWKKCSATKNNTTEEKKC